MIGTALASGRPRSANGNAERRSAPSWSSRSRKRRLEAPHWRRQPRSGRGLRGSDLWSRRSRSVPQQLVRSVLNLTSAGRHTTSSDFSGGQVGSGRSTSLLRSRIDAGLSSSLRTPRRAGIAGPLFLLLFREQLPCSETETEPRIAGFGGTNACLGSSDRTDNTSE